MGYGVWCLGFGSWFLGFEVWGLGFGVWGLGFGVWGLGLKVQGSGCRVHSLELKVPKVGHAQVTDTRVYQFGSVPQEKVSQVRCPDPLPR